MKKYTDHTYADCPKPSQHHKAAHRLIEPKPAAHTPTLAIVPEDATHIAFVNGPTISKEQILSASELIKELVKAVKAQMQIRDMKKPTKLDEALCWRDNDDLANKCAVEAIARAEGRV